MKVTHTVILTTAEIKEILGLHCAYELDLIYNDYDFKVGYIYADDKEETTILITPKEVAEEAE
jgi:hypothetical protein